MNHSITTFNFADHFIEKMADHLMAYRSQHGDFSGLMLVFGGKRPGVFLRRELARRIKTAFIPPKIMTMDNFISDVFRQSFASRPLTDLEAAFELYHMAQAQAPEILKGRESFARFWPWAREILGFFDQVDLEDVEDQALLNVREHAQIGYDVPDAINRLLAEMVRLRRSFHKFLDENSFSRRGWVYRQAARHIKQASFDAGEIWFCNFFYWHKTEEQIIKHLFDSGKARLFFQGDERRWPVLEKQAKDLGVSIREGDKVIEPNFDLKLYRCTDAHSETAVVREVLKALPLKDLVSTVIVAPEPRHLVPLLSEISSVAADFNVSMGYPLKRSSLYTLLTQIFEAQLSRQDSRHPDPLRSEGEGSQKEILRSAQDGAQNDSGAVYYARDYLKVLQHPFIKNLSAGHDPAAARILIHKIEEILTGKIRAALSGCLFLRLKDMEDSEEFYTSSLEMARRAAPDVSRDDFRNILKFIHRTFLSSWETVNNFQACASAMEELADILIEKSFMKEYPLNMPIARRMLELAAQWKQGRFSHEEFSQEDIFRIIEDTIGRAMVAFNGTPLKGLQVLGLFETRSLNFDHVIVIDANEGVFPRLQVTDPLIPREVSQMLGLSRLEIEEEIQRYQFLRLLSSSKSVHLVYQQNKETERSRFVEQLIWNAEQKTGHIDSVPVVQAGFTADVRPNAESVKKTPEMIEYLMQMTFSASSLNMYLRNPMDFYRQYVLGIREEDDLLDEPDAKNIGTFVHALLHEAFQPFKGARPDIDAAFRKRFEELFETRFREMFVKSMKSDAFLVKTVLQERLKRFLDHEASRSVKEIITLEQKFIQEIPLSCGTVKFIYVIDRIDRMQDGTVMIVDYKTGGKDLLPMTVERWNNQTWSREYLAQSIRSFQIPLYYHYLQTAFPGESVNAALYNIKTLAFEKFITQKNPVDAQSDAAFLKAVDFIISEILDPTVSFESV